MAPPIFLPRAAITLGPHSSSGCILLLAALRSPHCLRTDIVAIASLAYAICGAESNCRRSQCASSRFHSHDISSSLIKYRPNDGHTPITDAEHARLCACIVISRGRMLIVNRGNHVRSVIVSRLMTGRGLVRRQQVRVKA